MAARQFGARPEARRAVRRRVDLQCDVYSEVWGQPIPHRVTDVSEDGLWIETDLLLEIGDDVTLTFYPPDWDEPLCVAGCVQRVQLRPRPFRGGRVGMGIAFESLRNDERRQLTRSMRCLRAEESFILDQRTLTGVPVGAEEQEARVPSHGGTVVGWAAPPVPDERTERESGVAETPRRFKDSEAPTGRAFTGGLDLAASVFSSRPKG